MYEVIRELCAATKMEIKMVRVTGRVEDTYHARIYLAQVGNRLVPLQASGLPLWFNFFLVMLS